MKKKITSYRDAGVDIEQGDAFARFISEIDSPAVSRSLGGFSGGVELDLSGYRNPVLMSGTDGVGTKLLVARQLKKYDTIGIDLVAMCVNDLIVCNARPLSFLDYIACGAIDRKVLEEVVSGIVTGCEQAGCILAGGETAEMPDMYGEGEIDLAGFCTGIAEKAELLPRKDLIEPGNIVLGLPSAGIHSNGLSLARKVITPGDGALYRELLVPTKIYVEELISLFSTGAVLGAAHITGGGLEGNLTRVLPGGVVPRLTWDWEVPDIFRHIREKGNIRQEEMRKVFNMGIGIALVVPEDKVKMIGETAEEKNIPLIRIGELTDG